MEPSTIFFPLRTNVNYFQSKQEYMDLQSRVKQSLILYDKVVFQAGEYQCIVGPEGIIQNFQIPDKERRRQLGVQLEEDDIQANHFWLSVRPSNANPPEPFTTILDSPLERIFRSQFHTLVSEIRGHGINEVDLRYYELPAQLVGEIDKAQKAEMQEYDFKTENRFLKDRIITVYSLKNLAKSRIS
jgi:hypothetical protein